MSANSVDPNLKNDTTDEFIVGGDREVGRGFAVGANYIWRRYGNFSWSDRGGHHHRPTGSRRPSRRRHAARATTAAHQRGELPDVTFFQPAFQQPTVVTLTNVPDFNRDFNGFELTARKRMSNRWMMNTSFAYNSTIVNYGSFPGSQPSIAAATITEDPSNRDRAQRATSTTT